MTARLGLGRPPTASTGAVAQPRSVAAANSQADAGALLHVVRHAGCRRLALHVACVGATLGGPPRTGITAARTGVRLTSSDTSKSSHRCSTAARVRPRAIRRCVGGTRAAPTPRTERRQRRRPPTLRTASVLHRSRPAVGGRGVTRESTWLGQACAVCRAPSDSCVSHVPAPPHHFCNRCVVAAQSASDAAPFSQGGSHLHLPPTSPREIAQRRWLATRFMTRIALS